MTTLLLAPSASNQETIPRHYFYEQLAFRCPCRRGKGWKTVVPTSSRSDCVRPEADFRGSRSTLRAGETLAEAVHQDDAAISSSAFKEANISDRSRALGRGARRSQGQSPATSSTKRPAIVLVEAGEELTGDQDQASSGTSWASPSCRILDIDHTTIGPYIRDTLILDRCVQSTEEALLDIYRVLRPGEPPTLETAEDAVQQPVLRSRALRPFSRSAGSR